MTRSPFCPGATAGRVAAGASALGAGCVATVLAGSAAGAFAGSATSFGCLGGAALAGQALGQPEGAGHAHALGAFEAVGAPVAQQQPVDLQLPPDLLDRPQHARVVPGDEADAGEQQQRRVQLGLPERLGEHANTVL